MFAADLNRTRDKLPPLDRKAQIMRGPRRREAKDLDSAAQILELAQQTADQAIADAQREAEKILDRARQEAQQIIADAKARGETDTTTGP